LEKKVSKTGVLLMAYGSPDNEQDIEPYYTHIRGGRKPTPEELENLKERYRSIGGHSPLLEITRSTATKLQKRLADDGLDVAVYAGMKHWHPFIAETFDEISKDGIVRLVAIALAPHYSRMSIGSYQDAVRKANAEHGNKVAVDFVDNWYTNPIFIEKWAERINEAISEKFAAVDRMKIFFLFTAHSLPERILASGDPYKTQLLETTSLLARKLELAQSQFGFAFQSAGHTSEPWLGPDILDALREIRQDDWKEVLVIPIGFVSDHLEILFDIDVEAEDLAKKLGVHLERTESFNDCEDFIEILDSVVKEKL
jgi:protoporphyrin/coproporphyrin ferrochelatase